MDIQPHEFAHVPYGTIESAACAPKIDDPDFDGIAIRMPDRIRASQNEKISVPICGYYQLPTAPLLMGADIHIHIRGVGGTAQPPVKGKVVTDTGANEPDARDPLRKRPIDPKAYEGQVSEAYFYFDAQRYLPPMLPSGTYEVCVTYGQATSNMVRVTIERG
jgi:hypothetical protein